MNKKLILIAVIIIILVIFSFFWYFGNPAAKEQAGETKNTDNISAAETKSGKVLVVLDFGDGQKKETETNWQQGATVFDLTKAGAEKLGLAVESQLSSFGVLIEKINNFENGQGGKYWMLYINGQGAATAADKTEAKAGDKIEWKFIKPSF